MATGDGTCGMAKWEGRTCMYGSSESHGGFAAGARKPVCGRKNSQAGPVRGHASRLGIGLGYWALGLGFGPNK